MAARDNDCPGDDHGGDHKDKDKIRQASSESRLTKVGEGCSEDANAN